METAAEKALGALGREFKCPDCGHDEFLVYRTSANTARHIRRCKGEGCGRSWTEEDDTKRLGAEKPVPIEDGHDAPVVEQR